MIRAFRWMLTLAGVASAAAQAFWLGPPPPNYVNVREYVNDYTGHYVLLSDPVEIAAVGGGSAGPGWRRTGYTFTAFALSENGYGGDTAQPVCRFYAPGPSSHFFTANAAECDFLRTHDTGWIYEKTEFKIAVPGAGATCAGGTPIYRAYNNRFAENDSNHRYYFDDRVRASLLQSGWSDEGIAFCAVGAGRDIEKSYWVFGQGVPPSTECGAVVSSPTPCVALRGLPAMSQRLDKYLPPTYSQVSPDYTTDFAQVTGWLPFLETIYAPQITANHAADARHSFVQDVGSGPIGIHVAGADRIGGDYASISAYYGFPLPGPVAPGATYAPFTPWPHNLDRDLTVSFQLGVATIRRNDASSHAYGGTLIDFRDATSGHHVLVTLQAFGTNAAGDFVARDVTTGHVIVSTVFRADPMFGKGLQGDYSPCSADAASGSCSGPYAPSYSFRMDGNDFTKVLALARTGDPALSPLAHDYQIANFQLHIETYRDAEVGLEIYAPMISETY